MALVNYGLNKGNSYTACRHNTGGGVRKEQYLVQQNINGKYKFLRYTLNDNQITNEWGLIDGISQGVCNEYEPINAGKSNELTAEQAAEADYNRIIKRKIKEGYSPVDSLENLPNQKEMPLDLDHIPPSFCCSKPIKTTKPKIINKLIKAGNAKFFVKYNGACHYILIKSDGEIRLFTRRWDDHTCKYPEIVRAIKTSKIEPNSLLIVELCIDPFMALNHMTAQKHMSEIMKADTLKGVCKPDQTKCFKLQKKYPVKAAVFGYLYCNGTKIWHKAYITQWAYISKQIKPLSRHQLLFQPQEAKFNSYEEAISMAIAHKTHIEGFVVWDMTKAMEVTMNGKPLRRASWKIKTKAEMDVIAYKGKPGKKKDQYRSLYIGKFNDKGEMVPMGTVGGLKPKNGETDPSYWNFPCVIEVIYDNQFPDTGFLQFGSFSKIHEDKTIEEVELFKLKKEN